MSSKRDSLLLSGSVSRGSSVTRTASHDSIATHPLLSPVVPVPPASSSSSIDSHTSTSALATGSTPPRYVPYTPRQRGAPTPATTGATMHPISAPPQQHPFQGEATSKLQLVNLKAAAQRIGLETSSTGWAILERLSAETDHGSDWNEIWTALSTAKATLLLPVDPHPSNEPITVEVLQDHIAFCDGARNATSVITLSGLRGCVTDNALVFRSTLSPTSKPFQKILQPAKRASVLSALPPLPHLPTVPSSANSSPGTPTSPTSSKLRLPRYPTYGVSSRTSSLPLPPRPTATKPPLPPRPAPRTAVSPATHPQAPQNRLSNSFASFFGRATPPASPAVTSSPLHPDQSSPSTPASAPTVTALASSPTAQDGNEHAVSVPAYAISARIDRSSVASALSKALTAEIQMTLAAASVPPWAIERVQRFTAPLYPMVRVGAPSGKLRKGVVNGVVNNTKDGTWVVTTGSEEGIDEVAAHFQEFYAELEDTTRARLQQEARRGRRGLRLGRERVNERDIDAGGSGGESLSGDDMDEKEPESEKEAKQEGEAEEKRDVQVKEIMNAVERTMCSLFYDRLFLPSSADDASHDEALSSRIAAVNLLDLGLAHLGIDVGTAGTEVEAVARACGQSLVQLDMSCRAPSDKAAVLVAAHKIIVDGLSKLPPVGLRSEDDMLSEKTPRASKFGRHSVEDTEQNDDGESTQQNMGKENDIAAVSSPVIVLSPDDDASHTTLLPLQQNAPAASNDPPLARSSSPTRSSSRPHTPTPVSGDVILPLMIFAVVKANPPQLVSNLLYTQRFRREGGGGGEEGYCLINLMAVAEFLENVDLAALGLGGESEKMVISASMLSPMPLSRSAQFIPGVEPSSPQAVTAGIRGRVEQQVDAIAGSANKVITGVVDTSFGVLRMLLPGQTPGQAATSEAGADATSTTPDDTRPGFGPFRRDTGFSIASLTASLPGAVSRTRPSGQAEEAGQQMVEVPSRPGSSRSVRGPDAEEPSDEETSDAEEDEEEYEEEGEHDARSIRSFESMMSSRSKHGKKRAQSSRMSITDRLASMPGLSRLSGSAPRDDSVFSKGSPPGSRRSSLLLPNTAPLPSNRFDTPVSSRAPSPVAIRISPPNERFLMCTEDDIKVSEVGELLREYKRLAEAVRAMGGFHDE